MISYLFLLDGQHEYGCTQGAEPGMRAPGDRRGSVPAYPGGGTGNCSPRCWGQDGGTGQRYDSRYPGRRNSGAGGQAYCLEVLERGRARLVELGNHEDCGGRVRIFADPLLPLASLVIGGAGHVGQALCPRAGVPGRFSQGAVGWNDRGRESRGEERSAKVDFLCRTSFAKHAHTPLNQGGDCTRSHELGTLTGSAEGLGLALDLISAYWESRRAKAGRTFFSTNFWRSRKGW